MDSFHLLQIDVDAGGARKDFVWIFNSLEEIKSALVEDLEADAELALCNLA